MFLNFSHTRQEMEHDEHFKKHQRKKVNPQLSIENG
jgi:hypothetical protein